MQQRTLIGSTLSLVMIGLFAAACDNRSGPALEELSGPQMAAVKIVEGDDPVWIEAGYATADIGAGGGELRFGPHALIVPAGAVSGPTRFAAKRTGRGTEIRADLKAFAINADGSLGADVGAAGFAAALTLRFKYSAGYVSDESSLKLYWARPDGSFELVPSYVDSASKYVVGTLSHFSEYVVGSNNCDENPSSCETP